VKRTRRPCWQAQTASPIARCVFAAPAFADEDDRLAVVDPGALGQRGDRRLGHLWVVGEAEVLGPLHEREAGVDQPSSLAPLGALLVLGLEQRGEVGDRRLLLARGLAGERPEAAAHGRRLELRGVRLDQRLERGCLRGPGHREPPSVRSSS
jgi:hypothetical protein